MKMIGIHDINGLMKPENAIKGSHRTFDWNLLHTFVVLAEAGSVTTAAEHLGRKQPSVSNALRRLEDQIGKKLIDRSPGSYQLTDAGKLLYREAIEIYGTVTGIKTIMRDMTDEIRGHVRIVMASQVACPFFDSCLRAFHEDHPKATFALDAMASGVALNEVVARRASFAICLVHKRNPKLEYLLMYREFFGLFCGPSHPLFGRSGLVKEDLHDHSSVSFQTDRLDGALRPVTMVRTEAELDSHMVGRSSHLEEIKRMVIAGLGIGALPIHVVARDIKDGLLWRLPPYDDPPQIDVNLVWNPMARMNRAEQIFLNLLTTQIEGTPIEERTYL
jgi:DNA-binding transcriptional LysR family regulator